MIGFKNAAAALALSLAVVASVSPASAAQKHKSTQAGQAANAQAAEGDAGGANAPVMNKAREDAIRECSGKSNALGQTTWGYMQGNMYRTCMAERGQPE
jgi:uncharacterized low-complexity protein